MLVQRQRQQPVLSRPPVLDSLRAGRRPEPAARQKESQVIRHTDWDDLGAEVRAAVEARTGPVRSARTISAGLGSELAAVLDTAGAGTVFVKGLPVGHPGAVRQQREAVINPYVSAVAPVLLWHDRAAGWDLLAFEYLAGTRHADYSPGSADLPRVLAVMHQLAALPCPDLPEMKHARQRWAAYIDHEHDLSLLDGDALLHTDFNPLNILLGPGRAWIIDWAWPTRGAAFIDPACFLLRAMAAGHSPAQAEALAAGCPGWTAAPPAAIDVFAAASARLYAEIAAADPQPFKRDLAAAARQWASHRLSSRAAPRSSA